MAYPLASDGRGAAPVVLDLTEGLPSVEPARRVPVGRDGQLRTLRAQLLWCDQAVRTVQRQTARTMRDPDASEDARWDAVRRLREIAWKVCREILPLVGRVPGSMQSHPEFQECQRTAHALRRTTESVLEDNANYTVDLVAVEAATSR